MARGGGFHPAPTRGKYGQECFALSFFPLIQTYIFFALENKTKFWFLLKIKGNIENGTILLNIQNLPANLNLPWTMLYAFTTLTFKQKFFQPGTLCMQ